MQRRRCSLHDLLRDLHSRDAFQTWQFEHGVEQNALHDRSKAAGSGLALNRLASNGAQRLVSKGKVERPADQLQSYRHPVPRLSASRGVNAKLPVVSGGRGAEKASLRGLKPLSCGADER